MEARMKGWRKDNMWLHHSLKYETLLYIGVITGSISAYDDGSAIIGPSKTFSALVHCSFLRVYF